MEPRGNSHMLQDHGSQRDSGPAQIFQHFPVKDPEVHAELVAHLVVPLQGLNAGPEGSLQHGLVGGGDRAPAHGIQESVEMCGFVEPVRWARQRVLEFPYHPQRSSRTSSSMLTSVTTCYGLRVKVAAVPVVTEPSGPLGMQRAGLAEVAERLGAAYAAR